MLLRPFARSVLCLMFVLAAGSAAANDDWRQLQTPRYTIVSQLTDSQTRAWAGEFDEFIESVSGLLRVRPDLLPPLTVVLFAGDKQFDPYRPTRPNGRKALEVAGVFQRTATWSTIGLGSRGGAGNEQTRRLVFHEALHWLLSGDTGPKPRWYHEGLAELFSTFQTRSGKVQWGHPIQGHLLYLQSRGLMPLREFMAQRTSIFDRDEHSGQYYAQSWALVHFLLMGNRPERREQLLRFLAAYRTQSVDDAFAQSFGGDYDGLEKDLEAYVTQTRLFNYTMTDEHAATAAPYAVTSATPAFVQQSLGRVALGAADESLAKRHAAQALELDANGAGTHELRAYIARRDDDAPAALSAARAAIATGTRDAEMFVVAGDGTSGDAAALRRRVSLYERAIALNPGGLQPYLRLAQGLQDVDATDEDLKFMALGRRAFPEEGILEIGLARLDRKRGDRTSALQRINAALKLQLDEGDRQYATQLRTGWEVEALFAQAVEARQGKRMAEARRLYERILSMPDLPDHERRLAEEMLALLPPG